MNTQQLLRSSLRSLNTHKMRSLLTTLGIIIGVVSIISVMSIGEGAKYQVNKAIDKLGSNFIIVLAATPKHLSQRGSVNFTLTPADVVSIQEECDDVYLISPGIQYPTTIVYAGENWATSVFGVNEDYFEIRQWAPTSGEIFTSQDVRSASKVALMGKKTANELFGYEDPVGKIIRIKRIPFKVLGVLSEKGKTPDGRDFDDIIIAPITTVQRRLMGKKNYNALIMSAVNDKRMGAAARQVRAILRQNHRIREGDDDDFSVFTQDDISEATEAASRILNLLLLVIASISLLVGGIGIMNIMLVTVTERTQEIGLRMALGATTSSILIQFILEAITICLFGGLVGVAIGIAVAKFVGIALGWTTFISQQAVLLSLSSSVLTGLFFGYYPAYKASQLNPIEALAES